MTCRLCQEPIRHDQPTARYLGDYVHSTCFNDFEQGWDHDHEETNA